MQIFHTIEKTEYRTSVALGFFDGVHVGHRCVLDSAIKNAGKNIKSAVFTFKENPYTTLTKAEKPRLTTNEEKFRLFKKCGIDIVYCIDFNEIKDMSAEEFVQQVLCDKLNAQFVATGYNYHFGKGGQADVQTLKKLCDERGIGSAFCEPVLYKGEPVSSTRIRECIANGDIEKANEMLRSEFYVSGTVEKGNHIGRKMKTPTINLPLNPQCITPRFGVYASSVVIDKNTYMGATNIGTHPTVGGDEILCETHLLDFTDGDLYGKNVETKLLHFIRDEKKFSSLDELRTQIEKDKNEILNFFKK